jgi:hypothetical protein
MKTLFFLCLLTATTVTFSQTSNSSARISVCAGSPNFILNEDLDEECSKRIWIQAGQDFADNVALSLKKELKNSEKLNSFEISKDEIIETDTLPYSVPEFKRYMSLTNIGGQRFIVGKTINDGCVSQYAFRIAKSPKLLKIHKLDETILPQGTIYTIIIWPLYWAYTTWVVEGNKSYGLDASFFWTIYNNQGDLVLSSASQTKMQKSYAGETDNAYNMLCDEAAKVIAGSIIKKWSLK